MEAYDAVKGIISEFSRSLQEDGGNIELIGIKEGTVKVKISRTTVPVTFSKFLREHRTREGIGCGRCQIPTITIVKVLEEEIRQKVPGIIKVEVMK